MRNATDTVNGDTASPAALKANPGPDGISLREAILAAMVHRVRTPSPSPANFNNMLPGQVRYSIIYQAGFAGVNHNKNIDPQFVNPAAGDYHLQPGSGAIAKGTSSNAPTTDLDCQRRNSRPSIGAYEGNGHNISPAE